tara:strand:- start:145 stop:426 length:282 start_codon:yes stop_codon:yes gene_type:complete
MSDGQIGQLWGSAPDVLADKDHGGAWANAMAGCGMSESKCLPSKKGRVRFARKLLDDGGSTMDTGDVRDIIESEGAAGIDQDNIQWMKCVKKG